MCFMSTPSYPEPAPLEPAPQEMRAPEKEQQQIRDDARDQARKRAGLAGTIKTSASGLTDEASTDKKSLLGT